jgi:hypothetical protein
MTPNIDIVGSLKLIAYAPLEYGYKEEEEYHNIVISFLFTFFAREFKFGE